MLLPLICVIKQKLNDCMVYIKCIKYICCLHVCVDMYLLSQ